MQFAYPGTGSRRRRDRPGRDPGQFHGHRPAPRHHDQDLLGRRPPVRRAQPGHQAVRPGLRRRVQRLLGPLAPHHPRVQREDQEDAHSQRRLHDQYHRRLRVGRRRRGRRPTRRSRTKTITDAGQAERRSATKRLAKAHRYGGFVGAWTKTAKLTFPNVYIFGTDNTPGTGLARNVRGRRLE